MALIWRSCSGTSCLRKSGDPTRAASTTGASRLWCNGGMCTVILDLAADGPTLLAGYRVELVDRAWEPPGWHWPDHPGLIGGMDLQARGTWLAVAPAEQRVACLLNGRGRMAAPASRRTRGVLPLEAAEGAPPDAAGLTAFDPFHLLCAEPGLAVLYSWDGDRFADRRLGPGLHFIVNSGLGSELAGDPTRAGAQDLARVRHFLPLFRKAARPAPRPGIPVAEAWGSWLPLLNGGGIAPDDLRALIPRRDVGGGRTWGATSVSLIAAWPAEVRYDFTGEPGNPGAWHPVTLTPRTTHI
jgi:Transport and Golgi organisation 2